MGMFLVSFVILVALVTVLSGIGVGEHCGVGSGGVYSMISSVLGGQTGGTIGLLYVFGQVSLGGWGWAAMPGGPRHVGSVPAFPHFIDGQLGALRGTWRTQPSIQGPDPESSAPCSPSLAPPGILICPGSQGLGCLF